MVDVSVIIPVYNRQDELVEALDSLFWQRSFEASTDVRRSDTANEPNNVSRERRVIDVEAIVVDDGSFDPVVLPEPFCRMDNVRLIRKTNGGASSARNAGMAAARGRFIAFLDSDDLFAADKLHRVVAIMDKNPSAGFLFSDLRRFERIRKSEPSAPGELKPRLTFMEKTNSDFYPSVRKLCDDLTSVGEQTYLVPGKMLFHTLAAGYPVFPSTLVVRRNVANSIDPWLEGRALSEDFLFALRLCRVTNGLYVDDPLAYLGRGEDNVSGDVLKSAEADIEVLEMMDSARSSSAQVNVDRRRSQILPGALQFRYMRLGFSYYGVGRFHESARAYIKAFRYGLRSEDDGAGYRNLKILLKAAYSEMRSWLD
ncbi:glycosyltransferase family 2 protein [Allohahella marinimesophila]|uniref:Glycosyltransferase n=1 Tax=Allohahella marinimesophila TaxID=1054972 RepID=A0ABP7Q7N0_9GAMM